MKNKRYAVLALVIGLALVFGLTTGCKKKADEVIVMGTTNFDDLVLSGDLTVGDDATVTDDLAVSGDLSVVGTASWGCSNTTITDTLTVQDVVITDTLNASGNVTIAGTLDVAGNVASATGAFTINDTVDVQGDITLNTNSLIMDDDEDTTIAASGADDYITVTLGAAGGHLDIVTGNVKIGDGSPSLTLNGEDLYVEGTFEADGSARFDGGIALATGDLVMSNGLILPDFDDLTINDGDWLTPTVLNVYALDAASAVTMTLGACTNEGQGLTLIGDDNFTITIADANVRTTDGGVATLGQFDVIIWICQDAEWLHVSKSSNS